MKKIKLFLAAIAAMVTMGVQAQSWTGNDVAAGDFYLYNVGAGQWLTSGNSWGTQASLTSAGGFHLTLEGSGTTYAIKVTETRTNNKAAGPGYLNDGGYMDGESSVNWTFTKVEQSSFTAYRITSGDNALKYSGSGTVVNVGTDNTDNSLWILVSKQNRLDAMAAADADHPVDATFLLKNPDFGRYKLPAYDAAWTWTFPSNTNKNNDGDRTNFCVESYHVAFDFAQIVANAPKGYYAVRGQAFYRQDGSNTTDLPYFYVGDEKVSFPVKSGSENSMTDASNSFTSGSYMTSWSEKTTFAGGSLKVGAHLDNNTALWCIWDNIQIQYYGPIDLTEYENQLATAVTSAQAYESQLPAAVYANISAVITEYNKTYQDVDGYSAAITAINNAVNTYATAAIIADYARYNSIRTAAVAIASSLDTTTADDAVEAATTTAAIDTAIATLRAAFLAELPNVTIPTDPGYIDVTTVMVDNAGVHTNTDYWTKEGTPNGGYSFGVCNYGECEFYNCNFKFYQALSLSKGSWEFGVTGFHRAGNHNTHFYAGASKVLIPGVASSVVNTMAEAQTYFNNGNGKVNVKFALDVAGNVEIGIDNQDTETDKWTIFRDFTLHYLGEAIDLTPYEQALAAAVDAASVSNIPQAEIDALAAVVSANNKTYTTVSDYENAIANIENETAKAKAMQAPYATYKTLESGVQALFDVANYQELIENAHSTLGTALSTATSDVETKTTVEGVNEVIATLKAAGATYAGAANPTGAAKFDLTFMLTNPNLEGLPTWTGADGWYTQQTEGNSQVMVNAKATSEDGTKTAFYEYWKNPAAANNLFALFLKVTLPVGTYNMSCYAFAQDDGTQINHPNGVYFYANDVQGSAINNAKLSEAAIDFVNSAEQEVKIGLKTVTGNANFWMGIGYVELYKVPAVEITIDEAVDYTPASVAGKVTLKRTKINETNWSTFVVPFAISNEELKAAFGDNVSVAEFSDSGESANAVTVNFNTMDTPAITPNKPVLLKGAPSANNEYVFENRTVAAGEAKVAGTYVDFVGTYAASTKVKSGDYFISSNKLYKSEGGTTVKGTRAYIDAKNTASSVKLFIDDLETAIEEINGETAKDAVIYNLAGQRVNKAQKGIYIQNGKKVLVK